MPDTPPRAPGTAVYPSAVASQLVFESPLIAAVMADDVMAVERALEAHPDSINDHDTEGNPAVHLAKTPDILVCLLYAHPHTLVLP